MLKLSTADPVGDLRLSHPACPTHPAYLADSCAPCADAVSADRKRTRGEAWQVRVDGECDKRFPARYVSAVADEPAVLAWVDQVQADPATAPSLLLLGGTGVGKTYQAHGALRAALRQPFALSWAATTAADMYASLRPAQGTDAEARLSELRAVDLLLIDDLGAVKTSPWVEEITYRILNHRYNHLRPTILTSNLPTRTTEKPRKPGEPELATLQSVIGDRIASRLAEMCKCVVIRHSDRRRLKAVA